MDNFIGIDLSKKHLDVATHSDKHSWRLPNSVQGRHTLVRRLHRLQPALVVLEASGGLERAVAQCLRQAGLPVSVVNPRRVRDFAKALGLLAKTDRLDAKVLAQFAASVRPPVRDWADASTQQLQALLTRRRQLLDMLAAEKNRLPLAHPSVQPQLQSHIAHLEEQLRQLDEQAQQLQQGNAAWQTRIQLLQSVPGGGTGADLNLAGLLARVGLSQPSPDCRIGGLGSLQLRFWPVPGSAPHLGRASLGALGSLYGHGQCASLQPGDPALLPASQGSGQGFQSGFGCLHAQTALYPQRHAQTPIPLATSPPDPLTAITVATKNIVVMY